MEIELEKADGGGRFVAALEHGTAYLAFRVVDEETLDFRSTFVPPEDRHGGVGEKLVLNALGYAREHGYVVIPTCPFVRRVVDGHSEYRDLITS